jgi:hypothetical protein
MGGRGTSAIRVECFASSPYCSGVQLPSLNQPLTLLIKGKSYSAICTDIFDGGYGWYIDVIFPKTMRYQFSAGEQSAISSLPGGRLADFVGYPTDDRWKVRFLISN